MKKVYGYIRISTKKQEQGVSIEQQEKSITNYCKANNLIVSEWKVEKITAAKPGRELFNEIIKELKRGKLEGLVVHKIDRGVRNLKDWVMVKDLIDQGIEVHFAHENLDLNTRSGRLIADIQAVIATDEIMVKRERAIEGIYGRLEQGIYPFKAPLGYLDCGKGNVKQIDPINAPLVKEAFRLYAKKQYSLRSLVHKLKEIGLTTSSGRTLSTTGISKILNNPFYIGILKVKNRTFNGIHEPLIKISLFSKVQDIMHGKGSLRICLHDFLFRKRLKCNCGYFLYAEKQKGHVYYRCHTEKCLTKGFREEKIAYFIESNFKRNRILPKPIDRLESLINQKNEEDSKITHNLQISIKLQTQKLKNRENKLTDMFLDEIIDMEIYSAKKEEILLSIKKLEQQKDQLSSPKTQKSIHSNRFLELTNNLYLQYHLAEKSIKRKLLDFVASNFNVYGKKIGFTMVYPYNLVHKLGYCNDGVPCRDITRTLNGNSYSFLCDKSKSYQTRVLYSHNGYIIKLLSDGNIWIEWDTIKEIDHQHLDRYYNKDWSDEELEWYVSMLLSDPGGLPDVEGLDSYAMQSALMLTV